MRFIIGWCIENRILVIIITGFLFLLSIWSVSKITLDAVPDLSDTQVIVQANFQGQPPQIIEDQVTYPLTSKMLSVPFAKTVRGFSFFGFSLVYILFEDGTDLYWARSRVLEQLNSLQNKLPKGVSFDLGSDATSIGWIYQYALTDETGKQSLADLRDIQDFLLRYEISSLKGVAEVASLGGFKRQFQIELNPDLLFQYKINLNQVESAIKRANIETGARLFEQAETEYMVLAKGYLQSVDDIKQIPIRVTSEGGVLRLGDIAYIKEGPDIRRGIADLNGEGEVVAGIVVMRQGGDVLETINRIKEKLSSLQNSLPEGVKIITTYDRSILIKKSVFNLTQKLLEELIIVAVIIALFLWHVRSVVVAMVALPLGILFSFLCFNFFNIPANIMSLGGIAITIGVMVDVSIVMLDNTHKHLEDLRKQYSVLKPSHYWKAAYASATEVMPGLFWSMLIIILSFLPVFALPEQSGRLFIPLALTKTLVMATTILIAVFLLPVLTGYFIRGKIRPLSENPLTNFFTGYYTIALKWSLENKKYLVTGSVALLLISIIPILGIPNPFGKRPVVKPIGSEFMPPLEEGDILYMPTSIPGISISKAKEILIKTDALIKEVPEVKQVFGKAGRADTPTDPAPLSMIETTILLKDRSEWRDGIDFEDIIEELDQKVRLPGLVNAWSMPIRTRSDMLSTGIKTPVGIKIMGDDLNTLEEISKALEAHLSKIKGVSSVFGERARGGNYIIYEIDRKRASLYGLNAVDIHGTLSKAIGGAKTSDIIVGRNRWSTHLRYLRSYRESIEKLKNVYIPLPNGRGQIPVTEVATFKIEKGPAMIKTENTRKTSWLYLDTRETDIGSLVNTVKNTIDQLIKDQEIPWDTKQGYSYVISGQYEQIKLASERMLILVPLVLMIIFVILFTYFKNKEYPLWVMLTALGFAPLGGLWFMFFSNYHYSIASGVGFIALAGLAVETGVIMLTYLKINTEQVFKKNTYTAQKLRKTIIESASFRLRPVLMTALTDMLALIPLFWGDEPGNQTMRRIAAPMVGGSLTCLVVTLFLIPALYEAKTSNF